MRRFVAHSMKIKLETLAITMPKANRNTAISNSDGFSFEGEDLTGNLTKNILLIASSNDFIRHQEVRSDSGRHSSIKELLESESPFDRAIRQRRLKKYSYGQLSDNSRNRDTGHRRRTSSIDTASYFGPRVTIW